MSGLLANFCTTLQTADTQLDLLFASFMREDNPQLKVYNRRLLGAIRPDSRQSASFMPSDVLLEQLGDEFVDDDSNSKYDSHDQQSGAPS